MKIFILSALMIAGFAFASMSQSLQVMTSSGTDLTNTEIVQVGTPDSMELITYFYVKNISTSEKNVLCRKTEIKMLDSTEITMCWAGGCYPPKTNLSPNAQPMAPNEVNTEFVGHYTQSAFMHFKSGESVVRWCFFDKNNPADSSFVVVKYTTYPLGVAEKFALKAEMSSIYPNPASSGASVNVELPVGVNAQLVVRDMLGKVLYQSEIEHSGKVRINTTSFADGVYFCSLLVNDRTVETRKLIVRH